MNLNNSFSQRKLYAMDLASNPYFHKIIFEKVLWHNSLDDIFQYFN